MKNPDLPDPRELVLDKKVKVTSGIHGHTHRPPNKPKKKYFPIHDLEEIE